MLNQRVNRLRGRAISIIFAVVLGLGLAVSAQGQAANKSPERGFHAGGSYALSEIETISRSSGELSLNIPLGSLPAGRGGLSASLRMLYSSKIWDTAEGVDDTNIINPVDYSQLKTADDGEGNWRYGYAYRLKLKVRRLELNQDPCTDAGGYYYQLVLVTPDGGQHTMRLEEQYYDAHVDNQNGFMNILPDGQGNPLCSITPVTGPITYYTTDGSYLRLDIQPDGDQNWENNPWTLSMPDGTRVLGGTAPDGAAQRIIDRNGNFIDIVNSTYNGHPATFIKDQLGRQIIIETFSMTEDKIHVTGFNEQALVWTVQWRTIMVRKRYHYSDHAPTRLLNTTFRVVDKIILPTQTVGGSLNYTFDYNANECLSGCNPDTNPTVGWGELKSITLPSGASAAYEYKQDNTIGAVGNPLYPFWILRDRPKKKTLSYSTVYDAVAEAHSEVWLYEVLYSGNNGASVDEVVTQTTTTAPDGGISVEYAQRTASGPYIAEETAKTVNPDGSVVERIYTYNPPNSSPSLTLTNRFVKYEFTSVINQAQTQLMKTAIKEYSYDLNGNVLTVKEYDWVNYTDVERDSYGQPTGLPANLQPVRVTVNDYHVQALNFSSANLYSKPNSPLLRNAIKSSEAQNSSGTALSRSEFVYDNATTTGNLTTQKIWDSTKGGIQRPLTSNFISTSTTYDSYGNVITATDAKGVITTLIYGVINGFSDLYPTRIEKASNFASLKLTTEKVYDFSSGLETEVKDADNDVKTTMTYDAFGRVTQVIAADGESEATRSTTEYSDINRRVISRSDFSSLNDGKLVSIQHYDQLGRVRLSRSLEDAAESATDETKGIKVQTRYLFSGTNSYTLSSNPYRAATSGAATGEETMGWSRSKTDNGGRLREVESFSGTSLPLPWGSNTTSTGKILTNYDANTTTVTDQASKQRRSVIDGLGRLIRVDEPTTAGLGTIAAPNQKTDYTYDVLNNLTQVQQTLPATPPITQTRSFNYDSLKRLTNANNPESGQVSYTYDNNSNLATKTDSRPITTTYAYDALNRVTSRSYSTHTANTPKVFYFYDAQSLPPNAPPLTRGASKGRLVAVTYGSDSSTSTGNYYGYDLLGRINQSYQRSEAQNYRFLYQYNKAGAMTSETYPSNRVIETVYDAAGRVAGVRNQGSSSYYAGAGAADANRIAYSSHGAMQKMQLGNTLIEQTTFNARLQPTAIKLGTASSASSVLQLQYGYGATAQNNGNLISQSITMPKTAQAGGGSLTLTQSYTYDEVNRLQSAAESGGSTAWSEQFSYDRFGNMWVSSHSGITLTAHTPQSVTAFTQTTNQLQMASIAYDNVGNLTTDTLSRQFKYDAENRQYDFQNGTTTYGYDGDGRRVRKQDATGILLFVYNAMGQLAAEYTSGTPQPEGGGGTSYLTTDHLGSTRVVSKSDGSVKARYDFLPFGEAVTLSRSVVAGFGGADSTKQKFTGHERDLESGLDYMKARYCSPMQGRFTSVDPSRASAKASSPQSWNRYSYTLNNPMNNIDPDGKCSAPAGLKRGQVGICIEQFIAAKEFKGIGRGDNRTFSGSDSTLSARARAFITIEPQTELVRLVPNYNISASTEAGKSKVGIKTTINLGPILGPVNTEMQVGIMGEAKLELSPVSVDQNRNGNFSASLVGINGFKSLADFSPFHTDLQETIDTTVNFTITPGGKVGIGAGSATDGYPSVGIYSYTIGKDGKVNVTTLFETKETTPDKLATPLDVPIPERKP